MQDISAAMPRLPRNGQENREREGKKREMELRHDQEALNTFKAQSENFKKQIEESTDNPELKKDLEKMLKRCNEIWAERVMNIELEQESKPIFKPRLSSTF
jgi:hypothetical protein